MVAEGGAKYGPADVDTLKQWVAENRLTPTSMLEDAATGVQIQASQVPGLFPPAQPTIQQTPPTETPVGTASPYSNPGPTYQSPGASPSPYQQNPYTGPVGSNYGGASGESEAAKQAVMYGWICFALGIVCCFLISPGAIYFGKKAKDEGHSQGNLIFILGIIWTCLGVCGTIGWFALIFLSAAAGAGTG